MYLKRSAIKHEGRAFTLVELLVAIVIIGILATLATMAFGKVRMRARDSRRVSDIKQIRTAMEMFYLNEGRYPTAGEFKIGQPFSGLDEGKIFMLKVPGNPQPTAEGACGNNEYTYYQDGGGVSYHINWCLSAAIQEISAGPCIATPAEQCARCKGSCAGKCGGDDGCGTNCPGTCAGGYTCDTATNACLECIDDTQCRDGKVCFNNSCKALTDWCADNGKICGIYNNISYLGKTNLTVTCPACPSGQVCDTGANQCLECLDDTQCAGGKVCFNNQCKDPSDWCMQSPAKVCGTYANISYLGKTGLTYDCGSCPSGQLCDTGANKCTECVSDADCPGDCRVCNNGSCANAGAGTDPKNKCSNVDCSDYVYGWRNGSCLKYAGANGNNGACKSDGSCYTAPTEVCQGEGIAISACGSAACARPDACVAGSAITANDATSEICYTDDQAHNLCATPKRCIANGLCLECMQNSDCGSCQKCVSGSCTAQNEEDLKNDCGTCGKCVAGACTTQSAGQDIKSQCATGCQNKCKGGAYQCAVFNDTLRHNCDSGYNCYGGACCYAQQDCGGLTGPCPGQYSSCGVKCTTACSMCCKSNNFCGSNSCEYATSGCGLYFNGRCTPAEWDAPGEVCRKCAGVWAGCGAGGTYTGHTQTGIVCNGSNWTQNHCWGNCPNCTCH